MTMIRTDKNETPFVKTDAKLSCKDDAFSKTDCWQRHSKIELNWVEVPLHELNAQRSVIM